MVLEELFLLDHIHHRQRFQLSEMRPAFTVSALHFVITTLGEQAANRQVHQVLLLFFGEFGLDLPEFLDAYQEQNGFHIGLFAKALNEFSFQLPPPGL